MRLSATLFCLTALAVSGCTRIGNDMRPAPRREPVPGNLARPRLSVLAMTDPKAPEQFQGGIDTVLTQGAWRWTERSAAVRVLVPKINPLKLKIDATFPEIVFRETGPVTVAISVEGHAFDPVRLAGPGTLKFEKTVPAEWLRPGESAEIAMIVENGLRDPDTNRVYCLQLSRVALEP